MSGCDRVREDLAAWVDGELEGPAASELSAHLAGCAACAAEHQRLLAADRALLDALGGDLLPSPGWLAGVEARIREGQAAPARREASGVPGGEGGQVLPLRRNPWRVAALRVAAAVLAALAIGLGVNTALRRPPELAEQPLSSQRPSPRPDTPDLLPGQPTPDPDELLVAEVLDAVDQEQLPLDEILAPRPTTTPSQPPAPTLALAEGDEAVIEDLELLAYLADGEEVDLGEALELLEELAPEELHEG